MNKMANLWVRMDLENSEDDKSFGSAAKSAAEIKLGFNENCFYGESSTRLFYERKPLFLRFSIEISS